MNRNNLALCDKDNRYTGKLSEFLSERESFPFTVSVYDDLDVLIKDTKHGLIGSALISDDLLKDRYEEFEDICSREKIMLMILGTGALKRGRAPVIRKYRSGEALRKDILVCVADYKSKAEKEGSIADPSPSVAGHRETKVISAFTPVGRCLQSSFLVLLGQLLSRKYPVLYITLEAFSWLGRHTDTESCTDITDLIYYMRSSHDRLLLRLESMTCRIGSLDCIPPSKNFSDLCSVSQEDWSELIHVLCECGLYEYLILDLSDTVSALPQLLRESDIVYTITRPDSAALKKMAVYEETLKNTEYEDVIGKTRKLEFPFYRKLPADPCELIESDMTEYVKEIINGDLDSGF